MILGFLFLMIGLSILLKAVFHVDIPLVRTGLALFIIYIGVKMLLGSFGWNHSIRDWDDDSSALFNSKNFKWESAGEGHKRYSVVFGSTVVDLTDVKIKEKDETVEVDVVFGEATVLLSKNTPIRVRASAVFGEAKTPDENMVAFGVLNYSSPEQKQAQNGTLNVRGNVVFGALKFQFKD
jgi:predicted membrane protein